MELYHLLNRGVEKRDIFLDDGDRIRFVHDLWEFNTSQPANNTTRRMNDIVSRSSSERLVEIHGWCLMNNHYHLLVSETRDGGVTQFIRKLNIGYAKFFNEKYKRTGFLFQGRTKKIPIQRDAHFQHILHYIHLNPLDFLSTASSWRQQKITNSKEALEYLDTYRWSSYLDYCGKKNFPSLLSMELFAEIFPNYRQTIAAYLHDTELESMNTADLE